MLEVYEQSAVVLWCLEEAEVMPKEFRDDYDS